MKLRRKQNHGTCRCSRDIVTGVSGRVRSYEFRIQRVLLRNARVRGRSDAIDTAQSGRPLTETFEILRVNSHRRRSDNWSPSRNSTRLA